MKKIIQFFKFEGISDDLKRKAFYIFYVFFFVALIVYTSYNKKEEVNEVKTSDVKYEYRYEINNNDIEYILFGTKYNDEMTLTKRVEGLEYKYYRHYDNWYVLDNEIYIIYNEPIISGLDINYLNKSYIDDLMKDSVEVSFENNLQVLSYSDITFEKKYDESNILEYMLLTKDQLTIKYIYYYESVSPINISIE